MQEEVGQQFGANVLMPETEGTTKDSGLFGVRLRRVYILALGAIGLLSIAAFIALDGFIAKQGTAATVINVAANQKTLSQRIANLSQAIALEQDADTLQEDKTLLYVAILDMSAAHRALLNGNASRNLAGIQSPKEAAYYFQGPYRVDAQIRGFLEKARRLLAEDGAARRGVISKDILRMARIDLTGALQVVVSYHEALARSNAARAETIHLGLLIATLSVLLGEAFFIFSPLASEVIRQEKAVRRQQTELTYSAFHDQLTGLFNRRYLRHYVETLTERSTSGASPRYCAIVIDLDNFKTINDSNGHETGDKILCAVASVLGQELRDGDLAFRIGGDEFLVILPTDLVETAQIVAARFKTKLMKARTPEPSFCVVSASFGIATSSQAATFDEVVANADLALYASKAAGRNAVTVYEPGLRHQFETHRQTEKMIADALAASAFEPFFQPQIDMHSGALIGIEALARCQTIDGSWVSPADFIPIAEKTGQIVAVGKQVIEKAIESAACWHAAGITFGRLSVNASAAQLRDPDFVGFLKACLGESGLDASFLSIEILETVLFDNDDSLISVVAALRDLKIGIELDDFGTGYTSIVNVERFKVDRIKIDRSFIAALDASGTNPHVLKAILTMARGLNVDVIAEGIETHGQQASLLALGCRSGQGFKFAKPMSEDDLLLWIEREDGLLHEESETVALHRVPSSARASRPQTR